MSVGVFFPRYRCDRASDTPVATSARPPPHPPSGMLPLRRRARLLVSLSGSEDARAAKTTVDAFSWKPTPRDDPGCLPSARTLPRIRWPLQPRSHDHLTAFGDAKAAEQRSLVTLGLVPILSRRIAVRSNRDWPFARHARRRFHPPTLVPS